MIENIMHRDRNDRERARRMGISPSASLRRHFVALARQIRRWVDDRQASNSGPISIGITSLTAGAGKSTVSYNLSAAICSVIRSRTLLVESDFGSHYITRRLGQARSVGLGELLLNSTELEDAIHQTPITDLQVIGCGQKTDQEALELPFEALPSLISEKMSEYGYVVFDLPIADQLTACSAMAPYLDGVVLTVEANQIDRRHIDRFRKSAEANGIEVIGLVINKS